MGQVILIASGKGGTGKTVLTANLGVLLAERGYKTALLDMDMGMRNLDLYLGLENRVVYNIMDVFTGICRIKRALIKDKRYQNLYLMSASPQRDDRDITPLHMEILCKKMRREFDFILLDGPAGIGDGLEIAVAGIDKAVLVTEADIAAARDADIVSRYLQKKTKKRIGYVVNKVRTDLMTQGLVPPLNDIQDMIQGDMLGVVQYDDNIFISTNKGIPIALKQDLYITENLNQILNRILT